MGKNDCSKASCGGRTITKTYSLGVDGMKEHIFDCSGYNDTARFNKTQKELSNYIIRSSEKGGPDVAKMVRTLQSEDLMPAKPSKEENKLIVLKKDV